MAKDDFLADADRLRRRAMESLFDQFDEFCDGVVVVDRDARIVWMNDRYSKKLGIADVAAAIGKPVEKVIPKSLMRKVVSSGQPIMLDIMDFGKESFVVMRLPLHDDAGQVIGAVGMVLFDDARDLAPLVSRYRTLCTDLAEAQGKLAEAHRTKYTFDSIVGATPALMALKQKALSAAHTASPEPVLILGETGTGKELFAHAIHAASPRADGPFVPVNVTAVVDTLFETEFFGVSKNVFSNVAARVGKFKVADGGTLFLDEIGDMPLALQPKLLRALEEGEIEAVGSNRVTKVDVRVIAATNHNLKQEIDAGRFRDDLYFRLNDFSLDIPPLRERLDDLPLLCESLVEKISRQFRLPRPQSVSPAVIERLRRYAWPGNVRELFKVLDSPCKPMQLLKINGLLVWEQ